MARELYTWDQVRGYALIGLNNLLKKYGLNPEDKKNITLNNYKKELDPLQTSYGKDGTIGYANRLLKLENRE